MGRTCRAIVLDMVARLIRRVTHVTWCKDIWLQGVVLIFSNQPPCCRPLRQFTASGMPQEYKISSTNVLSRTIPASGSRPTLRDAGMGLTRLDDTTAEGAQSALNRGSFISPRRSSTGSLRDRLLSADFAATRTPAHDIQGSPTLRRSG